MNWRRPTSVQALELGEELYSWGDANCSTSFNCLLSETGMVQLHHLRHSGHEQDNGSEAIVPRFHVTPTLVQVIPTD